jgi:hypothetical protein
VFLLVLFVSVSVLFKEKLVPFLFSPFGPPAFTAKVTAPKADLIILLARPAVEILEPLSGIARALQPATVAMNKCRH